ncbi:MAG TPA: hypothetical protein VFH97_09415 [Gemmatimonadales bacterium]|nr:hypothetical protein [Gemmatimonadales bacterium]
MGPGDVWVLLPLGGMGVGALFLVGAYKIVMRWLDRRHATPLPEGTREELESLRRQVAELDELPQRVAELEERLDFAERMLAQHTQRPMLGGEH